MRRKGSEVVVRLTTIAILSALGFVLMAFARIPYPPAPWLMIEFSDTVVMVGYAMYGFLGGFAVAVIKTLLDLAVYGPVGLGIGNITALFTSLMFVLGLFLTSHVFGWFKKGLGFRILSYAFTILLVTVVLTLLNAIVITPSYLTVFSADNPHFSTCFQDGVIDNVLSYLKGQTSKAGWDITTNSYIGVISLIYGPFNLLKGACCCFLYEILFNRLIFVFASRSPKMQHYFSSGAVFSMKREEKNKKEENK